MTNAIKDVSTSTTRKSFDFKGYLKRYKQQLHLCPLCGFWYPFISVISECIIFLCHVVAMILFKNGGKPIHAVIYYKQFVRYHICFKTKYINFSCRLMVTRCCSLKWLLVHFKCYNSINIQVINPLSSQIWWAIYLIVSKGNIQNMSSNSFFIFHYSTNRKFHDSM